LLREGRLGQKNGRGFYRYVSDPKGRPCKEIDPDTERLLGPAQPNGKIRLSAEEITARMMLPMILEAARCVEDGIAATPAEVDMCLILGLGLPRYLGGALKYADYLGIKNVVDGASRWESISPIYRPSGPLRAMAAAGKDFYPG
jgi:3-hydroxyacyl-CoA dehydrogenase / enoyl-CoA hydratase / 3-hydroxybutyryl-CoA epimerase / enoyl-CoA isomerase